MKYGCLVVLLSVLQSVESFVGFSANRHTNLPTRPQQPGTVWKPRPRDVRSSSTSVSASPLVASVASPVGAVSILAFVVLIHELGHYSLAKRLGVLVEEFSVGFGPKVLSFKARGDDFSLRAIPLGGYVRFPENYNTTLAREIERREFNAQREYMESAEKGVGWEALNLLSLGVFEDREWEKEKRRRKQAEEETIQLERRSILGRIFRREATPKAGADDEIEYYDDPRLLQNRPWTERAQVVSGGVIFNILLAFALFFGQINVGAGAPVLKVSDGILVTAQPPANVAASGRLNQGDLIVGVNGVNVGHAADMIDQATEVRKEIDNFIATVRNTPKGESISLSVLRDGKSKTVNVTPQLQETTGRQSIGVFLAPKVEGMERIQEKNPVKAAQLATKFVFNLTTQTAKGLLGAFSSMFNGSGEERQFVGPVGLIQEGSSVVSTKNWSVVFLFAATISVNLAVLNSLPLPALDGGQMVFILAEALTGRKVNQKLQDSLTGTAVLLLLGLSLYTFVGDIAAIFF